MVGAREPNTFPRRRFSPEVLAHVRQLETVCERHGVSLAAAALQYVVQHPTVAAVIAGRPQSAGSAGQRGGDAGADTGGVLGRGAATAPPLGGRRAPPAPGGLAAGRISFIQYIHPPRLHRIVPPRDKVGPFLHIGQHSLEYPLRGLLGLSPPLKETDCRMYSHVRCDGVQHTDGLAIIGGHVGFSMNCEGTCHRLSVIKLASKADEARYLGLGVEAQDV